VKRNRFDKRNRTIGLSLVTLAMFLLLCVAVGAQTKSPLLLCEECLNKGDFSGAVDAGNAATKENPQKAEAWLLYGRALYETGAFDEAEAALIHVDPLTDKTPLLAETNAYLGNVYLGNQGELEKAFDCFQKEMAYARQTHDDPGEALAHYNLGHVLRKRDAHTEARKEFEDALKLETRDSQRLVYQAALAEELFLTGNTTAAIGTMQVVYHTAIKGTTNPKSKVEALFAYGQLYTLVGEAERKTGVPTNANQTSEYFKTADAKLQEGFKALRDANVKDLYLEALGFKAFGKLVEIQGNIPAAIERYKQALKAANQVGRRIELVYDLKTRIADLGPLAHEEYLLGAIDIGSKGVKGVLVSMVSDGKGKTAFTELYRRSINSNLNASLKDNNGNFSTKAMKDTGIAVRDLIRDMAQIRPSAPKKKIVVAGSSSLALGRNRPELAHEIYLDTKDEPLSPAKNPNWEKASPYVTSGDELFYGILGSIKPEDRQIASLVDIGSGNGRWGYIYVDTHGRTPVALDIRLGSVSLSSEAEKSRLAGGGDYTAALEQEAEKQIGVRLRRQIAENSVVAKRTKVYIVGGAAYALVSLLHPEASRQDEVVLTHEDLRRFYDLVKGGTAEKPYRPDVSQIADVDTRDTANVQIEDVLHKVFPTREQLLSAAILLKTLETNALKPEQKLVFPRHGGWALGLAQEEYFVGGAE